MLEKKLYLNLLFIGVLFTACEPVEEELNKATLKNNLWIATTCSSTTATDQNGLKHYFYYKGLYKFDKDNTIKIGRNNYKDSSCTQFLENHSPTSPKNATFNFYDLEKTSTVKDYSIHKLRVEKVTETQLSVDAFYAINEDELCLSESFYSKLSYVDKDDNKTYESMVLDVSKSKSTKIDYKNCLRLINSRRR
ncbi:MAG TPA: hypothetical protein EYG94_08890 [Campylobacterales bacterium]|nr:hypothetical protein [Campylobacterales bacterium]